MVRLVLLATIGTVGMLPFEIAATKFEMSHRNMKVIDDSRFIDNDQDLRTSYPTTAPSSTPTISFSSPPTDWSESPTSAPSSTPSKSE